MTAKLPEQVSAISPLGAAIDGTPAPKPRRPRPAPVLREVTSGIVCFCGGRFGEHQALEFMLHLRAEVGEHLDRAERKSALEAIYREANRELLRAKGAAYREANRELLRAKQKSYAEKNREAVRARANARYAAESPEQRERRQQRNRKNYLKRKANRATGAS